MKKIICLLLCAVMLMSAAACAAPQQEQTTAPHETQTAEVTIPQDVEITFTDDLDRTVTMNRPQRVAVMIGSFADVWCLAGGKDTIVAAAGDTWTQFDLGLSEEVANLGAVREPNVEALLASNPDFVIGSTKTSADVALVEELEEMGIPCAMFNVSTFDDYLRMLKICTDLTGKPENYETYGTALEAQVEAAKAMATGEAPTVLYVRASGSSCKVKNSQNTVLGEMLADLGCINIADSETGLLEELSMETIIKSDPDFIFAVLQGSDIAKPQASLETALLSNPAWEGLTAVREGRFHILDQKLYNLKPNAKWGDAYEQLAQIIYSTEE